jgi:hypothetical protein
MPDFPTLHPPNPFGQHDPSPVVGEKIEDQLQKDELKEDYLEDRIRRDAALEEKARSQVLENRAKEEIMTDRLEDRAEAKRGPESALSACTRILVEYNNMESNIPQDHSYWVERNKIPRNF